jgi:uncharacterized protein (TIGR00369 family)
VTPDLEPILRDAVVGSAFGRLLGLELVAATPDRVTVRLPFRADVTTVGDLVHGGAIGALVDVAATAAAWSGADVARGPRGTTIGLTVSFLAGARGHDLVATAVVVQRGRSIVVVDVAVDDGAATAVARALVTYKLSHRDG